MRVLLISHPPEYKIKADFPPPGISYLAAVAKRDGYEVRTIDAAIKSIEFIKKTVANYKPDIIGLTCWTISRSTVWSLSHILKDICPNVPLIIGGQHSTYFPEHIFKKTHATAVVIGEGEETFSEMLKVFERSGELKNVPGLALRGDRGEVVITGIRRVIQDLDVIPYPDYDAYVDFDFSQYSGIPTLPKPVAAIISSRGCIYNCSYCSSVKFWGNKWRFRSADNVVGEVIQLVEKYGVKSVFFFDDNFMVRPSRVEEICNKIIENGLEIKWACASHVNMIKNLELLKLMRSSGCVSIDFGVESGSAKILNNINKKQTPEDIHRAFDLVKKSGIIGRAYLMVGNKGEDESTIQDTIKLITTLGSQKTFVGGAILMLLPGTDVYNEAVYSKYISDDYWLENDDVPYNLQEHTLQELQKLRNQLMYGIAKNSNSFFPLITYYLKKIYYKYPALSRFRQYIPNIFR